MPVNPAMIPQGLASLSARTPQAPRAQKAVQQPITNPINLGNISQKFGSIANRSLGLDPNKSVFMPISADPNAAYTNPYAVQDWQPSQGVGPGGAGYGAGAGGPNRYDYTAEGSGLWSVGIDRGDPQAVNKAISWYQAQDPSTRAEIGALGGRNVNDPVGLLNTIDQRQRDVARNIQKENGFFDSTFGKILGTALPFAAGFIPGIGPMASAAIGAGLGGAQGGLKGALLGGASSLVGPSIKMPGGLGSLVRAPVQAATNVAKQFANPATFARQIASSGIGSLNNRKV